MWLTCITYLVILLSALILLVKLGNKRLGRNHKFPLPPSPPRLPIIGNLHQLGTLPHRTFRALSAKYGPIMLLQLGQIKALIVSSPKMAQEITKTHDLIFAYRPEFKNASIIYRRCYGAAFATYGEQWRQARKHLVTHLLSSKMMQSFHHVREQEVHILIDTISIKSSSGSIVNMREVLNIFSLDIICRVVCDKFRDEAMKKMMCEIIDKGNTLLGEYNSADFFPIIGLAVDIGLDTRAKKLVEKMDMCMEEMMKDHAGEFEKDDQLGQHTNFIGALISLEKNSGSNSDFPFTKESSRGLLVDVFAAGVDTSYIVLEWSMAELIRNPKSMKRLQDEVRRVGNNKNLIGEDHLKSANFLKTVIKESMRLHPPGPILLPREAREDCEIVGYHIPKGTRVLINAWAIARDPEIWEEPEEFRPERFLNSDIDYKGNNFEYLPFGAGRRICTGMNFAMPVLELAIANLVCMFDWELPKDMTIEDFDMEEAPGLTVRRKNCLKLYARPFSFELIIVFFESSEICSDTLKPFQQEGKQSNTA